MPLHHRPPVNHVGHHTRCVLDDFLDDHGVAAADCDYLGFLDDHDHVGLTCVAYWPLALSYSARRPPCQDKLCLEDHAERVRARAGLPSPSAQERSVGRPLLDDHSASGDELDLHGGASTTSDEELEALFKPRPCRTDVKRSRARADLPSPPAQERPAVRPCVPSLTLVDPTFSLGWWLNVSADVVNSPRSPSRSDRAESPRSLSLSDDGHTESTRSDSGN